MIKKTWNALANRCRTCTRVTLIAGTVVVALIFGGVLMVAGAAGLAWTNTEKFCIGCHEMKDTVYAEFKDI